MTVYFMLKYLNAAKCEGLLMKNRYVPLKINTRMS